MKALGSCQRTCDEKVGLLSFSQLLLRDLRHLGIASFDLALNLLVGNRIGTIETVTQINQPLNMQKFSVVSSGNESNVFI